MQKMFTESRPNLILTNVSTGNPMMLVLTGEC